MAEMKCFLGHTGIWKHDITDGTLIKIRILKIHLPLYALAWYGRLCKSLFTCHFSLKTQRRSWKMNCPFSAPDSFERSSFLGGGGGGLQRTAKWSKLKWSVQCALVPFEGRRSPCCLEKMSWSSSQLYLAMALIEAPERESLDSTNMHAHISSAHHVSS